MSRFFKKGLIGLWGVLILFTTPLKAMEFTETPTEIAIRSTNKYPKSIFNADDFIEKVDKIASLGKKSAVALDLSDDDSLNSRDVTIILRFLWKRNIKVNFLNISNCDIDEDIFDEYKELLLPNPRFRCLDIARTPASETKVGLEKEEKIIFIGKNLLERLERKIERVFGKEVIERHIRYYETINSNFYYTAKDFSEGAWKRSNGLPNSFPTAKPQRRCACPFCPGNHIIKEFEHRPTASCSYFQAPNSSKSSEMLPRTYKGCPLIDLSGYETLIFEAAGKIDLHPVYNGNFKKHLRDEIYRRQLAYQHHETREKKLYIITGTGQQRPGPNFRLQNTVQELLEEDYFWRRIAHYRLEKEGLFALFLRKNKKALN